MLSRLLLFAGLFFVGGCAYGVGDDYQGGTLTYREADSSAPYQQGSPVYGVSPYGQGPVMGGIYATGDADDIYGGPIFSPYHGIRCDRRRQICWGRNGPDDRWTYRFFGHRSSNWNNAHWSHGSWNQGGQGGYGQGGYGQGGYGQGNNRPYVYQVPKNPDGRGTPTFLPNGCGGPGLPPCH